MKYFATILAALATAASAHMRMSNPPSLMGFENPFGSAPNDIIRAPISAAQYPCQGYHELFKKNDPAAQPVAKWETGSQQKFQVMGAPLPEYQASHGGGSCQVSFSIDAGKTFRVVKSFIGDCPSLTNDDNNGHGTVVKDGFPFTVPKDLPTGPILFAWTWFNKIGNREMYMNCAVIDITGETGQDKVKFNERPEIFKANIDNGCSTPPFTDVRFPAPGPDVVVAKEAKIADPEGNCGPVVKSGTPVEMETSEIMAAGSKVKVGSVPGVGGVSGGAAKNPVQAADGNRQLESKPDTISAPADPAGNSAPTSNASSGSTKSGGVLIGKCDIVGTWNCIDGKSFQQCASGAWSVSMAMAAGTACRPGLGATLEMTPAKRDVRFSNSHVRRHLNRHRS